MLSGWNALMCGETLRMTTRHADIVYGLLTSIPVLTALVIIAALLSWRLWRFTIWPFLRPDEIEELPYWIPYLGHALSFFQDSHGTLTYARHYFNNTRRPFRITLAGQKFYVLTSPQDAATVYKNTTSLSFDGFMRDAMVSCGISPVAIEKVWLFPEDGFNATVPNPEQKCLAQITRDFHKQQLLPGKNQDILSRRFQDFIDASLSWSVLKAVAKPKYVLSSSDTFVELSLKGWCGDVLLNAATRAFFGEALLEVAPNVFRDFFLFDDNSWMLIYGYPRFLARDMYRGKEASIDALTSYFKLAKEHRQDNAFFVRTLEQELRDLDINERDIAAFFLMMYWVVNSNTYKLCFWIFSHLLHDPALMGRIREETDGAFSNGDIDMSWLLYSCPRLNAFFDEVMRMTNSSSSVRSVVSDTMIGDHVLRSGMKILIPYRQLHFNEEAFGKDALDLDPERFLKEKNLNRSISYRPFGGGSTYCPGRFIARQEVVAFVSIVLNRFSVRLAGEGGIPQLEEMKPCLGVMGPVEGGDLTVRVEQRH